MAMAMAMATMSDTLHVILAKPFANSVALGGIALLLFFVFARGLTSSFLTRKRSTLPSVPAIPGLPLLGNLLQLKEKKPHKTFAKWAEIYGPIYSIKTGASTMVVLNSAEVAKEAMVTRFSSISTRKLSNALRILTFDKCMVATSDYDDFHKMTKRHIVTNVLGPNAQKRHRRHRDAMIENITRNLHASVTDSPNKCIDFRHIFESELFATALKLALGEPNDSIYVKEFGRSLSREEIFHILVTDMMEGAIEVDWRDFFPYLKWIPNMKFERGLLQMDLNRRVVMKALIDEEKKRIASGQALSCYLDHLLSEAKTITEEQIAILVWEVIIETSDTTMVAAEWALYELSKDQCRQDRLYQALKHVCGSDTITEEKISQVPYLMAVFHETLRKHSPAPIVPLRFAHEDTQLGGYHIPSGTEIAINIYGCNMDKRQWENPEDWRPERFLDEKYETMDLQKTMAFGAGKRACAGALQAMLMVCTAIGRLVQKFEWRLAEEEEENEETVCLTSRKLHPLKVLLKPRTE